MPSAGPAPAAMAADGIDVHAWEAIAQPGPAVARELRSLARIVGATDPDLVHLHSSKAGLVGRLLIRRARPTVMQPHAWSFFAKTGTVRRATLAWERAGARWSDVVLCVSEDERRLGEQAGIRGRYVVLPNGVDLDRFPRPDPDAREQARAELGLAAGPLAVCLGRLHRQKNQGALLDIWHEVRTRVPGAELVLVGDGPDRADLERRGIAGVRFVGQVPDSRPWLAAASLVVQPSRWEGMSLALLEAMACARSVVVTDVSGMREVVTGEEGVVVPTGDGHALAEAVAERLSDAELADAEGRAGRARVEAHHDRRRQHEGIARLYDDLGPRSGGR